jgi:uncharacterized 2Fe-2S/4Fe-4S cluster protein (DUF4445 family)
MVRVFGDVKVDIPPATRLGEQRLQIEGREGALACDPPVVATVVVVAPAAITDQRADWQRLVDALAWPAAPRADPLAMRTLSGLLRAHDWEVQVRVRGDEVVDFAAPDDRPLGLAFDLGTTKIAGYLVDMVSGEALAADALMNPQIAYGEDVMSRIACAMRGQAGELQSAAVQAMNELRARLGAAPERIVECVVVGNTAMHHLFAGLPVRQLGTAPYVAAVGAPMDIKARDLGLQAAPGAYVHLLPNVAGFVGADHVAMVLACGIGADDRTRLGLDIGTNTEIVLAHGGALWSCSTASGPAFEGAHIRHGMRAASGAVEQVTLRAEGVAYRTIGDAPPVGLCGSAVLDAVAELRRAGLLSRRGRLLDGPGVREVDGRREFVVVSAHASGRGEALTIDEHDIGEILLAKAAIRTGVDLLMERAGIAADLVDEVVLAGAFGNHIRATSAQAVGLLPDVVTERINPVGNAAGSGARMALVSGGARARAAEIARSIQYVELMTEPAFARRFARAMYLPDPPRRP